MDLRLKVLAACDRAMKTRQVAKALGVAASEVIRLACRTPARIIP